MCSLLSGDLTFLVDDFLLGDLLFFSEGTFLFITGEGERLFGDLPLLCSEEGSLSL